MTPRCFLTIGGMGPRRTGGEIFSNVKTGIVVPLVAELETPLGLLRNLVTTAFDRATRLTQVQQFNHNKRRTGSILRRLRSSPPNPKVVERCSKPFFRHSRNPRPASR